MKMDFDFEIDEITIEVANGLTTTFTTALKVYASTDRDEISVDQIDIYTDQSTWERIDDLPQFKAFEDAVKRVAHKYVPEQPRVDPNKQHYLLASQLV